SAKRMADHGRLFVQLAYHSGKVVGDLSHRLAGEHLRVRLCIGHGFRIVGPAWLHGRVARLLEHLGPAVPTARQQPQAMDEDDAEALYRETTPRSRALHEKAVAVMPGGTTRTTTYFDPYPVYIERGEGCRVWDADGNERIDMLGNYTAMILGHAHPKVVEAIQKQAARGTGFAAANAIEVQLATLLCERVPSLDAVRFCNSGTEATMFAMRLARAFTGRPKI